MPKSRDSGGESEIAEYPSFKIRSVSLKSSTIIRINSWENKFSRAGSGFYLGASVLTAIVLINSYGFLGIFWLLALGILMFVLSLLLFEH